MHWGGPASPGRTHLPLRTQETGLAMAEGFWSNHLLESKEGGLWSQGFLKLTEYEPKAGKFSTNRGCGSVAERLLRVCKDLGSTPNSKKRTKVMILGSSQNRSRARGRHGSAGLETRCPVLAERASPSSIQLCFFLCPPLQDRKPGCWQPPSRDLYKKKTFFILGSFSAWPGLSSVSLTSRWPRGLDTVISQE